MQKHIDRAPRSSSDYLGTCGSETRTGKVDAKKIVGLVLIACAFACGKSTLGAQRDGASAGGGGPDGSRLETGGTMGLGGSPQGGVGGSTGTAGKGGAAGSSSAQLETGGISGRGGSGPVGSGGAKDGGSGGIGGAGSGGTTGGDAGLCPNSCDEHAVRCIESRTAGSVTQTCLVAPTGCPVWSNTTPCPQGQVCNSDGITCFTPPSSSCKDNTECRCGCGCYGGSCQCTGGLPPTCQADRECGASCAHFTCVANKCTPPPEPQP